MISWKRWASASILALVLHASSAVADAPTEGMDREARSLFSAASSAYGEGRYESALEYFERAYALSGRPALLFNMAATADRLRRDEDALGWYRGYLEALPDSPNATEVKARIAVLERTIEARHAKAAADAEAETVPEAPPAPEPREVDVSGAPAPVPSRGKLVAGVASSGAGALLLVVGAATGGRALTLDRSLSERCDPTCAASDEADLTRRDRLAAASTATLVTGAVAAAAGVTLLVLHLTGATKDREAAVAVAPLLGPGVAGAAARWSF
jgi:tetratricopeptide (TPR) repeat protein